jgi:hypothetical protein
VTTGTLARIAALFLIAAPAAAQSVDSTAVRATVSSFFAAVQSGARDSAFALMTPEWQAREREWRGGFTNAFFTRGIKVRSWAIRELTVSGDSAYARVAAVLLVEGEEDNEGMRFRLVRLEGRWLIRGLD